MKAIACFLLLALALFAQKPAPQSQPQPQLAAPPETKPEDLCTIEGQVFSLATGAPVPKAEVILRGAQRPANGPAMPLSYSTVSDAGGNFIMKDLEPGKYRLSIQRTGYVSFNYGSHGPARARTLLSLDPGHRLKDLVARLTPHAIITGHVIDDNNEPVVSGQVEAMRYSYQLGRKQMIAAGSASTNDLGEYRIYGLAPGRYYLAARPGDEVYENVDRSAVLPAENCVRTYYPGTIDPAAAAPLEVGPGMQMRGVNLSLAKARTFRVRGRVEGRSNVNVTFVPRGQRRWMYPNSEFMTGPKGIFEINRVLPGVYSLSATAWDGQKIYSALQDVDVGESNIEDLVLTLAPGVEIGGHFEVQGTAAPNLDSMNVYLRPQDEIGMMYPSAGAHSQDGTFTISNVALEAYSLQVTGSPDGYWVKSILMGDQEVKDTGIDLAHSPAAPLTVTLAPNAAQIDGVVLNERQQPAAGAMVVLVPEQKLREQSGAYKTASSDQNGRFTFKNLDPGDYTLFAWEDVEYGAYMDPNFLKPVEDRGQPVSLQEGGRESVQLNMIPADAAVKSQR